MKPLPLQLEPLCWKCGGGYGPTCWRQGEFLRFLNLLCGNSIGGSVNCGNYQAEDAFIYLFFFSLIAAKMKQDLAELRPQMFRLQMYFFFLLWLLHGKN